MPNNWNGGVWISSDNTLRILIPIFRREHYVESNVTLTGTWGTRTCFVDCTPSEDIVDIPRWEYNGQECEENVQYGGVVTVLEGGVFDCPNMDVLGESLTDYLRELGEVVRREVCSVTDQCEEVEEMLDDYVLDEGLVRFGRGVWDREGLGVTGVLVDEGTGSHL